MTAVAELNCNAGSMEDDFTRAILICFSGSDGQHLKEQATAYLSNLKQSVDVWKLCVERFSGSAYQEVKFWCLQTLHEVRCACAGMRPTRQPRAARARPPAPATGSWPPRPPSGTCVRCRWSGPATLSWTPMHAAR